MLFFPRSQHVCKLLYFYSSRSRVLTFRHLLFKFQRSNELSSEIKELDSDMQMLVYENYNKFICATDTIQQMKLKVLSLQNLLMMHLTSWISRIHKWLAMMK